MRVAFAIWWLWSLTSVGLCQEAPKDAAIERVLDVMRANEEPKVSCDELKSKSELIVIATVIEKRLVDQDYIGGTDFDVNSVQRTAIKLKVLSVIKGDAKNEIEMISTEWLPKTMHGGVRANFACLQPRLLLPNLCAVEIEDEIVEWGMIEGGERVYIVPEYLLYLKPTNRENTYTPVTGQRWGRASVRELR